MAQTQTIVQLSDELLAELDSRCAREGRSRSELIREAIEIYLADDRQAAVDQAIVDGYTRIPPTEDLGAAWAAEASIQAQPWEDARASDRRDHVLVTRNGRPAAVLVPIDEYEALEETAEILSEPETLVAIEVGLAELARDETVTLERLRGELADRRPRR